MPSNAVAIQSIDNAELQKLLQQSGMISSGGGDFHRMTLQSGSLVTDTGQSNEESWPPVKNGPTMTVRIVKPPVYYNAFYLSDTPGESGKWYTGAKCGHPEWNGRFVKKYDDPAEQAADKFANAEIYEAIEEAYGERGAFKADILLQIVPASGVLTGEETVYTLSMSTTSALDFRGSSSNPQGGVVQDKNFIVQLAELALARAIENNATENEQRTAVLDAMTALRLGNVIADIYLLVQKSKDASFSWTVISFRPIDFQTTDAQDALGAGESPNPDDLPF